MALPIGIRDASTSGGWYGIGGRRTKSRAPKDPALFTEPSCYPPASADYRAVGSSDTHQLLKGTTKDDDPSKEEDQDEEEQPGDY